QKGSVRADRDAPAPGGFPIRGDQQIEQGGNHDPANPASTGSTPRRRSVSSPTERSRRPSRPMTKKKTAIRPLLIQWQRSISRWASPSTIEPSVAHNALYAPDHAELADTRATTVALAMSSALPDSVARNCRSGADSCPNSSERRV